MSRLDELIKNLCPNGVEYKKLGDITLKIIDGMHNLPKGIGEIGEYPILSAQNINQGTISMETSKWVNQEIFESENRRTDIKKNDVLLTIVGAIGRTAVVEDELKALFQRSICVLKPNNEILNSRYLAYALESSPVQAYMKNNAHGAAQKGIYLNQVSKIVLPVPPLKVQREIICMLDRYTMLTNELTAKLTAELTARQKQYEYYRDKLLSFDVHGGEDK